MQSAAHMTGLVRLALCLAGVLAVAGCRKTAAPPPAADAPPPRFSVLTFNVNYAKPRPAEAIAAIREAGADVVCLQEADEAWEKILRSELSDVYPHMLFDCGFFRAGGIAVLSRLPLDQEASFRPEAGLFPVLLARAQTPAGAVYFLNVHLRPPQWLGGPEHHSAEMRQALSRCKGLSPLVVLGDFNETDSGAAVAMLQSRGLSDALKLCDPNEMTWHMRTRYVTVSARLDHILAGPPLRCLSARTIPCEASDHLPVLAIYERLAP